MTFRETLDSIEQTVVAIPVYRDGRIRTFNMEGGEAAVPDGYSRVEVEGMVVGVLHKTYDWCRFYGLEGGQMNSTHAALCLHHVAEATRIIADGLEGL